MPQAKKASRDPLRGGGGSAGGGSGGGSGGGGGGARATSPDGMGQRYDKSSIHGAGGKRPASALSAGTSPQQTKAARTSPSVSPSSQAMAAAASQPSAASVALYAARVSQGVVADSYVPPDGEPAAEGACYALAPMTDILARGFTVGEPMAYFSKAVGCVVGGGREGGGGRRSRRPCCCSPIC